MLAFSLLGPVEAISDTGPLELGGPQQRALLALLLLRANEVVPRDRLIDELWGDAPPATARETVKVYVGRLRKILDQNGAPERLVTRNGSYMLQIDPEELDIARFQRLAEEGSRTLADGDPATAASVLREALALWRGPPLVDVAEAPFAPAEQSRLEELRLAAVEDRIDADLALARTSALVPELRKLIRDHPYRERFHRQLMLALYGSGRQAEALAAFQDARTMFVEQLGIEPSNELRRLERAILTHDPALETHVRAERGAAAPPGRRRLRRPLALGAAALVAAAAAIVSVLLTRGGSVVHVHPNSVAVIDPTSNKLVADVSVGRAPGFVVAAYERVWVANTADSTVTEIDPDDRTVLRTIPLDARPAALAAGSGGVWVVIGARTAGSLLELARIDPRFGAVSDRRAALGTASQGTPRYPLALAMSTIWAPGRFSGTLVRRDQMTLAARGTIDLDAAAAFAIAADPDEVWAVTVENRLLRIDPVTNEVIEKIATGSRPLDVAVGAGAVWIAAWGDDVVIRYDPVARTAISIAVGDGPAAVSFGFGSVWVACSGDGTVWRLDAATRKVIAHWKLGASPEDITAGDSAVWAAVYSKLPP
jgi:DNA-binding SARP family transcriptional activator/DNA-binding beta-propeller fold protein YncE